MKKVFVISAALRSERVRTAKKIHQRESFVKLAICVENPYNLRGHNDSIRFECDEYGVIEDSSSKGWQKVFSLGKKGNLDVISVPKRYIMANIIPE